MSDQEVVAKFFEAYPQWKSQANANFLIERAQKPVTVESLAAAAYLLRDTLPLSPDYEEEWQSERERLEREKELAERSYYRPDTIGSAHRSHFIEMLRAKEIRDAASKEYEALIKQLGEKFRGQTLPRLREIAEKRRVHGLTASQFKQERAAQAPKETPKQYDGYPILPDYLVLPGDVQQTKIDAACLSRLVRTDYYIYRRLFSKYGGQQLTDRQQGA